MYSKCEENVFTVYLLVRTHDICSFVIKLIKSFLEYGIFLSYETKMKTKR